MKKIDINTVLKISIMLSILTVSFSIAYYFLFFLPSGEKISKVKKMETKSFNKGYLTGKSKERLEGYNLNLKNMQKRIQRSRPRQDKNYNYSTRDTQDTQITQQQLELQQQQLAIQEAQRQQQLQDTARILDKISNGYEQEREREYQQKLHWVDEMTKNQIESSRKIFEGSKPTIRTKCTTDYYGNVNCESKESMF